MGADDGVAPTRGLRRVLAVKIRARWLLVIVPALYVLFAGAVWFGADSLIFVPHEAGYQDGPEIQKIAVGDQHISAVHRTVPGSEYTVLFAHGNAVDLGDLGDRMSFLTAAGYDVLAFDYRGYGTSDGSPSEGSTYADIDAAYRYLLDRGVDAKHVIVLGHSMGSGPALHLATTVAIGGLVLESPFTTAFRVAVPIRLLPFDRFDNRSRIGTLRVPVAIAHGTKDDIIPTHMGREVFRAAPTPKLSLWVEGAGHEDVFSSGSERYTAMLESLVGLIEAS